MKKATSKQRPRVVISEAGSPSLVTPDNLLELQEQFRLMQSKLEALEKSQKAETHLADREIKIGLAVSARVGPKGFVPAEVVDVYKSTTGAVVYELRRLDEARKGLGLKPATDLYPASKTS